MMAEQALGAAVTVLETAAPVAAVALGGFVWARLGRAWPTEAVTRPVFALALPALLFGALVRAPFDAAAFGAIAGAAAFAYLAAAGAIAAGLGLAGMSQRVWLVALVNGNTGNLGLPLLLFAFGPEGLAAGAVIFAVQSGLTFTLGLRLISGQGSWRGMLGEPVLWASGLGVGAALAGWAPPGVAMRSLDLAGQAAIPIMLFTLGHSLAGLRVRGLGRAGALSLMRLAPCGAAAWGAAALFALPPVPAACLALQLLTPAAVTSWLMAARHGREPEAIAALVAVSTALAVLTLPAALLWVGAA